jgi:hypothetical protein
VQIPDYVYTLYDIAKQSFTLYEQGELLQSTEMAYELRDFADHLINGSRELDPQKAEDEFRVVSEHILKIAIDPLQRRTQSRVIKIHDLLSKYWYYRLLHNMPDRFVVEQTLVLVDVQLQATRDLKGRTDLAHAERCFEHVQRAYTTALNLEKVLNVSRGNLSVRAQIALWSIGIIVGIVSIAITLW